MDDVVHKGVTPYSGVTDSKAEAQKYEDIAAIESVTSDEPEKDHANYQRMDNEIAKYAEGAAVHVDETESRRLRKMIDRRVLVVMIITYFIQVRCSLVNDEV